MKKGIQYSHYCGTELQNLCDYAWLAEDDLKKGNNSEALKQLAEIQKQVLQLRNKIAELDKLNEMNY